MPKVVITLLKPWFGAAIGPLFALAALLLCAGAADAAKVTVRPDLGERIYDLRRVFPARLPDGIVASKIADPGYVGTPLVLGEGFGENVSAVDYRFTLIHVEGEIERGDADRLRQAINAAPTYDIFLSFDSPGGVFGEAFRISEAIQEYIGQDPRIGGYIVFRGNRCLSACAIVFALAGSNAVPGVKDNRYVEAGAELGFHMPYFPRGAAVPETDGTALLDVGYDVAAAMLSLLANNDNPAELVVNMLKHRRPDDFFMLRGDLDTWRMGFSPVVRKDAISLVAASGMDTATVGHMCNLALAAGRAYMSPAEDEFCDFRLGADFHPNSPESRLLSELLPPGRSGALVASCDTFTCQARVDPDNRIGISVFRGNEGCPIAAELTDNFPERMCPGNPVGVDLVTNRFLAEAYSCRDGRLLPGTFTDDQRPTVKRDVNFREEPTTASRVIGTVGKSEPIAVDGCVVTTDDQGVWYRIVSRGRTGWISARFVSGHAERFQFRGARFDYDPR